MNCLVCVTCARVRQWSRACVSVLPILTDGEKAWLHNYISHWCSTAHTGASIDAQYPLPSTTQQVHNVSQSLHAVMNQSIFPLLSSAILWSLLLLCLLFVHINLNVCAPACFLFVNNSVTFDKLGTLSGFSTSVAALFR